jgi:predicted alpha/beta superfamily hydrolase
MIRQWLALSVALVVIPAGRSRDELPGVTGTVKQHPAFPSKRVAPRNVSVWLPPSYESKPDTRYPVLYMHDGQNLFDPQTSFINVDWGVDEAMTRLIAENKVREAIVVGVWNTPRRTREYLPAKAFNSPVGLKKLEESGLPLDVKNLLSDEYLKFLVTELKPFIDATYRTRSGRADTSVMGSSAGALISLYAICEYPDVFGGAGCVSTHWPIAKGAMIDYAADKLPDPATHKLYFDFGTETLDKPYESYQKRMDEAVKARGYVAERNWMTRKFAGADHSERAWRKRVDVPLAFLLMP